MIVGCYTLDLYCENLREFPDGIHEYQEFPHQFTAQTRNECFRKARRAKWKFKLGKGTKLFSGGRAYCPKCAKKEE